MESRASSRQVVSVVDVADVTDQFVARAESWVSRACDLRAEMGLAAVPVVVAVPAVDAADAQALVVVEAVVPDADAPLVVALLVSRSSACQVEPRGLREPYSQYARAALGQRGERYFSSHAYHVDARFLSHVFWQQ